MVKLLVLLSMKRLDWQVRMEVLVIAVSGAVGGVNAAVYTGEPSTNLKLEIYPGKSDVPVIPPPTLRPS